MLKALRRDKCNPLTFADLTILKKLAPGEHVSVQGLIVPELKVAVFHVDKGRQFWFARAPFREITAKTLGHGH